MKIIRNIEEIKKTIQFPTAITLGNFDGIHLGHITLINRVKEYAASHNLPSVVVTYHPNPSLILGRSNRFKYLTSPFLKEELIREMGIDYLVIIPFNLEFAAWSAQKFITEILIENLQAKYIAIGFNHHFGKDKKGNFTLLQQQASLSGYVVEKIEQIYAGTEKVSSSIIREAIHTGDMEHAAILLGRYFEIDGIVIGGHKRGKSIGYPTANLQTEEHIILPPVGVYSGYATFAGKKYKAMVNIGYKPTFNDSDFTIECHILDFNQSIYDSHLRIQFIHKIRDEQKFNDKNALIQQLKRDEETVRQTITL